MTAYLVYDVFTDRPFGGNQLAVFPDATGLAEHKLQAIASEFNFSEVTFVYPPTDPKHTAKVRIFTPTMEIPFAGHPTIGTAITLRDQGHVGDMVLELGIGPIPCTFADDFASFTTCAPLEKIATPDADLVAAALGIAPAHIKSDIHPPLQASLGLPFVITEVDSRATLSACQTDEASFRIGAARYPAGLDFAQFVYVRDGDMVDARMFAPLDNITEDPATGSACATLAALLSELNGPAAIQITQGVDMGRPSKIMAKTIAKTEGSPVKVTISGQAVLTMEGKFLA